MGVGGLGSMGALVAPPPKNAWRYPRLAASALPDQVFLTIPTEVQDQGDLGSCVGQSLAKALEILDGRGIELSALGIYYNARVASGLPVQQDSGAYLDDGVRSLAMYGAGSEALWPYRVTRYRMQPSVAWRDQAIDHRVTSWFRAMDLARVRSALANGSPVVLGFEVPPGFEETGVDGVWHDKGGDALGGHAVCCIGYTPDGLWICNSWSSRWGVNTPASPTGGYFFVPYAAFTAGRFFDSIVLEAYDARAGG